MSSVLGGIKIPRDDCEWRAGGLGDMANRCDGDQLVVGACGSGFNNDCPGRLVSLVQVHHINLNSFFGRRCLHLDRVLPCARILLWHM